MNLRQNISGDHKRGHSAMSLEGEKSVVKKRRISTSPRYPTSNREGVGGCVWEGRERGGVSAPTNIVTTQKHQSCNLFTPRHSWYGALYQLH